ncbi:MAG: fructuronate reductase [Gammaproteobacteria bacterium]|jgi:fructuronate reductase
MKRLSTMTVGAISPQVTRQPYLRKALKTGIVHLGIGAFHRGHQAVYTDSAMSQFGGDWMTVGVSLRSENIQRQLAPQDGLFTVLEQDSSHSRARLIGSIAQVLFLAKDRAKINEALALESVRIISLTITEKGYCRSASTGKLDINHPDIIHDLENVDHPVSAIGLLVQALNNRYQKKLPPLSILSCDNLPANGRALKTVIIEFAQYMDAKLALWIEREITFPCSMVDRIVPAVTAEITAQIAKIVGLSDQACIVTEPFSQWVIEDNFVNGRPRWEKVGAILTTDVEPYEEIKLRLLNGAHSSMAYLGYLAGLETVADCMESPLLRKFIETLMRSEIAAIVKPPVGYNVPEYIDQLLHRFSNQSLKHQCMQIAMDGSQKIPQRLLSSVSECLLKEKPIRHLSMAVAAWMIYVSGVDENGEIIQVQDPLAEELKLVAAPHRYESDKLVSALLDESPVFTAELIDNTIFRKELISSTHLLLNHGVLGALHDV